MGKKIRRKIAAFLLLIIIIAGIVAAPTIMKGYKMYQKAITKESVQDKIDGIRAQKGYIKLDDMSKSVVPALIKSEDQRFYIHPGIDFISIGRAIYTDIKARSFKEGGSTITQQLAKNMYFSFEKKMERKVAEVFVAFDLENKLTKDEILELYLNVAYFGNGCYGLKQASNYYYGVAPKELSKHQAKALIFTLKSPNNYNPIAYNAKAEGLEPAA